MESRKTNSPEIVLVEYTATAPARAELRERHPTRPHIVKVVYCHSRTAAWIDEKRIIGFEEPHG
jgi:hypothetical protein